MHVRSYSPTGVNQRLARPRNDLSERTGVSDSERAEAFSRQQRIMGAPVSVLHRFDVFRPFPLLKGSRFCPECIHEHQIWRPEWRDPLTLVCLQHSRVLRDICPGCESRPFSTIAWARRDRHPATCTEYVGEPSQLDRSRRTGCFTNLSAISAEPATTTLLRATEALQTFHENGGSKKWAGREITNAEASRALTLLTYEALHTPRGKRLPVTALQVGRAPQSAFIVLNQPSLEEAGAMADHFDLLRVHGRLAPIGPAHNIRSRPLEPLLHAIRLQSLQNRLPPTTQLAFRAGSSLPRAPHELRHRNTPTPKYALDWKIRPAPFSAVPQLWYPLGLPGFDLTDDERAQFAISIAVICVGRSISVASAAERLGAPKHAAARITGTWKRLCKQTGWPTLRQAILRASDRLTHDPSTIDYASRRRALSSPAQVDLLAQGLSLKASFSDPERLWTWCHFTQASPRYTPMAWGDLRATNVLPEEPSTWKRQLIHRALTEQCAEPETWTPP